MNTTCRLENIPSKPQNNYYFERFCFNKLSALLKLNKSLCQAYKSLQLGFFLNICFSFFFLFLNSDFQGLPNQPTKISKKKDEQWVNDMLSRLNPRNQGFLIQDLVKFNLVPTLLIPFNCTSNCLLTFNCIQLHPCQIQISASKFNVFYK